MSVSGRDRDPAFRRKKTATTHKPTSKEPVKTEAQPAAQPKPEPKVASTEAKKDDLTTPVTEPVKKIEPALEVKSEPVKKKPESKPKTKDGTTSKKSKIIGGLVAIVFLIGIAFVGYYIISSIQHKEGVESTGSASSEEGTMEDEANAGAVVLEEENSGEQNENDLRETTLTPENSLEEDVTANDASETSSTVEDKEKDALKSVIRKKGDFQIPCWIVAFSANNKKPLANMNYSALEALGYDAGIYWIPKYFPGGQEMYKVYVGPYSSPEEAQAILPQIRNLQPDAYVMKIDE